MQAQPISSPLQRLDGKQDKWAPRYLCVAQIESMGENLVPWLQGRMKRGKALTVITGDATGSTYRNCEGDDE
ncbi:hypothetical protein PITC_050320 [Penicillium italicum]|uniref:Uncharacterized protein n=1 Tax=Penicillium italicum TaxID=40296 RepID=A0A0A2L666_PENIT|nr:hypothetical protein PITC_050320 [Penicillium italicum]